MNTLKMDESIRLLYGKYNLRDRENCQKISIHTSAVLKLSNTTVRFCQGMHLI